MFFEILRQRPDELIVRHSMNPLMAFLQFPGVPVGWFMVYRMYVTSQTFMFILLSILTSLGTYGFFWGDRKRITLKFRKRDNELILEEQYLLRTVTKIYELDSICDMKSTRRGNGEQYELILYLKPNIKIKLNLDGVHQPEIQAIMSLLKTFLGWNK
jgi:hypothetical protein